MYPTDNVIRWEVPARGDLPAVKIHAYDHSGIMPPIMKEASAKYNTKFGEDTLYIGEKGRMKTFGTAGGFQFLPHEQIKDMPRPEKTLPRAHGGPISDLLHVMKNGGTPCSDFVTASGPLTAFALTGHVAMLAGVGKKIEWDVEKMQCTNLPEANQFARRDYRQGWEL